MTAGATTLLKRPFVSWGELIAHHARERPQSAALIDGQAVVTYRALDGLADRVAASLARDGIGVGDAIAIVAGTSVDYVATFIGAVRAGVAVAPLPPSYPHDVLERMVRDCGAKALFLDASSIALAVPDVASVSLDGLQDWLAPSGEKVSPPALRGDEAFNIIYSSGTTGLPKGIVQSHAVRWAHVRRGAWQGYGPDTVTLVSIPLYSNTTLVSLIAALGLGSTVVLMRRFHALEFLKLSEMHRVTHAMLVPVQYRRLMDEPTFGEFDLSSYRMKFCTSAPFPADLKREVVARWPGGLLESYGLTEGGAVSFLPAHERPDKLHTAGRPAEGHDMRLIDEDGRELPPGATGEIVGHSAAMMTGYLNRSAESAAIVWISPDGKRFIRTGDIGRFDDEGFVTLVDRKKDMINSGGFNVYPSDLESELRRHEAVAEAAVVGVPSQRWGETPVAFVVLKDGAAASGEAIRTWLNARLAATQRVHAVQIVGALPRSEIGKILKRELRDAWLAGEGGD